MHCNLPFPLVPSSELNKGMAWERSREKAGLAGMLVMEVQACVFEGERDRDGDGE